MLKVYQADILLWNCRNMATSRTLLEKFGGHAGPGVVPGGRVFMQVPEHSHLPACRCRECTRRT